MGTLPNTFQTEPAFTHPVERNARSIETDAIILDHQDQLRALFREGHGDLLRLRMLHDIGQGLLSDPIEGDFDFGSEPPRRAGTLELGFDQTPLRPVMDQALYRTAEAKVIEARWPQLLRERLSLRWRERSIRHGFSFFRCASWVSALTAIGT